MGGTVESLHGDVAVLRPVTACRCFARSFAPFLTDEALVSRTQEGEGNLWSKILKWAELCLVAVCVAL